MEKYSFILVDFGPPKLAPTILALQKFEHTLNEFS